MRWLVVAVTFAGGCFDPRPPSGAPCDPAIGNCPASQACLASGDGFRCVSGTPADLDAAIDDAPVDAPPDALAPTPPCPSDPDLSICLSFDTAPLTTPLANEGALTIGADLVDVSRIPVGSGGAALLGATSSISYPANTVIVGIVAIEARIRLDQEVPDAMRVGIIDVDTGSPGMALFVYDGTTTSHRVRCTVGGADAFFDTTLVIGTWSGLACTCENGNVTAYKDGLKIGEAAGCAPAAGTTDLQIGQNSRAKDSLPPNEPMIGAIDRVRMWKVVPPIGP